VDRADRPQHEPGEVVDVRRDSYGNVVCDVNTDRRWGTRMSAPAHGQPSRDGAGQLLRDLSDRDLFRAYMGESNPRRCAELVAEYQRRGWLTASLQTTPKYRRALRRLKQ
jgi:hypothetical protein